MENTLFRSWLRSNSYVFCDNQRSTNFALGYYNARGGVDASGYYGDSWNAKENLTSQEYDAVIKGAIAKGLTGAQIGAAINEATAAKRSGSTINVTTGAITASATPASSSASTSVQ